MTHPTPTIGPAETAMLQAMKRFEFAGACSIYEAARAELVLSVRRHSLEDAMKATCTYCAEGIPPIPEHGKVWGHRVCDFWQPCDASAIRNLIEERGE